MTDIFIGILVRMWNVTVDNGSHFSTTANGDILAMR